MDAVNLKIGGVYRTIWDGRPYRVLGFDRVEVFYDCLWSDNTWTFVSNLKKKCYFYRTSSQLFQKSSQWLELMELTQAEWAIVRPDLPLRIGRTKSFQWSAFLGESFDHFENQYKNISSWPSERIETAAVALLPYGPNGGLKKGKVVEASDGTGFTYTELVWRANQIQWEVNPKPSQGIGIYRIGFEKGLPSYYIGDYFDKAGLIKE